MFVEFIFPYFDARLVSPSTPPLIAAPNWNRKPFSGTAALKSERGYLKRIGATQRHKAKRRTTLMFPCEDMFCAASKAVLFPSQVELAAWYEALEEKRKRRASYLWKTLPFIKPRFRRIFNDGSIGIRLEIGISCDVRPEFHREILTQLSLIPVKVNGDKINLGALQHFFAPTYENATNPSSKNHSSTASIRPLSPQVIVQISENEIKNSSLIGGKFLGCKSEDLDLQEIEVDMQTCNLLKRRLQMRRTEGWVFATKASSVRDKVMLSQDIRKTLARLHLEREILTEISSMDPDLYQLDADEIVARGLNFGQQLNLSTLGNANAIVKLDKYLGFLQSEDHRRYVSQYRRIVENHAKFEGIKEDKKRVPIVQNNFNQSNIGVVAETAHSFTQIQNINSEAPNLDEATLDQVTKELEQLRVALRKEAETSDHDKAVVEIGEAVSAAKSGNSIALMERLKAGGNWAFEVATKIGTTVAAELIKRALFPV